MFKNFHSGKRIQKVADLHAGYTCGRGRKANSKQSGHADTCELANCACTESRFSRCESLDWLVAEHSGQSRVRLETLRSCV